MRESLARWIAQADALHYLERLGTPQAQTEFAHVRTRADDHYISLVGELFERMREGYVDPTQWARLGNALALFAEDSDDHLEAVGVSASEAALLAAAAFYIGGYPASAYLTVKEQPPEPACMDEIQLACFDLLARPEDIRSQLVRDVLGALRRGQMDSVEQTAERAAEAADSALLEGPHTWIPSRVLQQLLLRFKDRNIRAVLPEGKSESWNPLVSSLLDRKPSTWEFFPSQIEAIRGGLLERREGFTLQMPTGAGKTALCEILLYWHLRHHPRGAAVLIVPYRSLASELRRTLVRRLNEMGISAGCAYGGTVPTGDEVHELDDTRMLVATPEALSGLMTANSNFFQRLTLVVCDEGHLLDGEDRGVSLELLLARMKSRGGGPPRFVFVSAIVPNIEEINVWLGGTAGSLVRSDYRPTLAEFAVLSACGSGASREIALTLHPHENETTRFEIDGFLRREDFCWTNPTTGRSNTYRFGSMKVWAIAAARKVLPTGAVAIFAANKRGDQGAVGLAEELVVQLARPLSLPEPIEFAHAEKLAEVAKHLENEYGADWVGTRALRRGVVLHHGDIPQETREVVEELLRCEAARLAICTNTLAEGVNLPIRTLVLYSVRRRRIAGPPESLLARDIMNLVGRAGRAGSTTKGLVICVNQRQWPLVERVARQLPGERVTGALLRLLDRLGGELARSRVQLTNPLLEGASWLHPLVDGVDAILVELAAEELGEEELIRLASQVADETFAARQAGPTSRDLLKEVFALRASRVADIRSSGRLSWIRDTGTHARMLDAVETGLLPRRTRWDDVTNPVDRTLVSAVLEWAWTQADLQSAVHQAYRLDELADSSAVRDAFFETVRLWLSGSRFCDIAERVHISTDDILGIHARVLSYVFQAIAEQGIAILGKLLESTGGSLSQAVARFPDHLRFGVPTIPSRVLAVGGVRHRRAAVELGTALVEDGVASDDQREVFWAAQRSMLKYRRDWISRLGTLVASNTLSDLSSVVGRQGANRDGHR